MLKKFFLILVAILLFIGFTSYVNADTNFSFEENSINVVLNGTKYIFYNGGTGNITWSSEDNSIASVDKDGKVSGLKIGETTISATRGEETATCEVNVIYDSIQIGANGFNYISKTSLVLTEHDSEDLYATVKDWKNETVNDAVVNWKSSDSSIVKIDSKTGKITAVKSGTATITAEATGVIDTCEVTVYDAPEFTDFKNAKYETSFDNNYSENLKISGITPKDDTRHSYYYIITSNKTKPKLVLKRRNYR